jgi:tetratricopeptide (TPR) repeat protein
MTEKINIRLRHKEAMENAQQALVAKEKGDNIVSSNLYLKAFEIEKEVALYLENDIENEPTRSVIFRSAASLANICGRYQDAEELINKGLSGNPPKDIEDELKALLKEITKNTTKIYVDRPFNKNPKRQAILPKINSVSGMNLTTSIKHFSRVIIEKLLPASLVSQIRRSHVSH